MKYAKRDNKSSCIVTVSDVTTLLDSTGRCDSGSDDSIVCPRLAEAATLKGIRKLTAIEKTDLSVALKKGDQDSAESFSFPRTRIISRTILQLFSGNLAQMNIIFLVVDDDLACEDLVIGRPVPKHLRVDTHSLLDNNRFVPNGADLAEIGHPTSSITGG